MDTHLNHPTIHYHHRSHLPCACNLCHNLHLFKLVKQQQVLEKIVVQPSAKVFGWTYPYQSPSNSDLLFWKLHGNNEQMKQKSVDRQKSRMQEARRKKCQVDYIEFYLPGLSLSLKSHSSMKCSHNFFTG